MTANVQGSNILDVLKKKMRATKEECEKYKEESEDTTRKLQLEITRREEVLTLFLFLIFFQSVKFFGGVYVYCVKFLLFTSNPLVVLRILILSNKGAAEENNSQHYCVIWLTFLK